MSEPTDIQEHDDEAALARKKQELQAHREAEDFHTTGPQGRVADVGRCRSVPVGVFS